jgi:hypothetical protein
VRRRECPFSPDIVELGCAPPGVEIRQYPDLAAPVLDEQFEDRRQCAKAGVQLHHLIHLPIR